MMDLVGDMCYIYLVVHGDAYDCIQGGPLKLQKDSTRLWMLLIWHRKIRRSRIKRLAVPPFGRIPSLSKWDC